jgi:hypothetical protein
MLLSIELGFVQKLSASDALSLLAELKKMLNALRRTLVTRH